LAFPFPQPPPVHTTHSLISLSLSPTQGPPLRLLTLPKRKKGGRNSNGKITTRHQGGGHKRRIRLVDFMRTSTGLFDVIRLEYDPGRSAHIALVCNRDPTAEGTDKWAYILAPEGLKPGDTVQSFRSGIPSTLTEALGIKFSSETLKKLQDPNLSSDERSEHNLALGVFRAMTLKVGNVLPLRLIPPGTEVHNIAIDPKGRFKLVRSAGSVAMVVLHEKQGEGEYQRCPAHTFSLSYTLSLYFIR
jgi:ribosomal protein L2